MKIAYLINQYPKVSHSFIRREIAALEALGITVERYTIRSREAELVDDADKQELAKTRVVLGVGVLGVLLNSLRVVIARPLRFLAAGRLALQVGWGSERGVVIHLIYLAEACVLLRWFAQSNITHTHAHFGTNSTTVAMLCHALGGPPYSFTVHGPEEFDKVQAIALPEKLARAAFVVAISSFGKSQLFRWCDYPQWSKIHVVRCGVDETFLSQPSTPIPTYPQLICVGRLSEQKGHLLLVTAASQLVAEGMEFKLVLVGDGTLRPQLETRIAELGLERYVEITGWATSVQVRQHLLASQILVLPSFAEGLPVVIMEALALARPVISTYIAGIPEIVIPGKTGWLVPAGSVEALTATMRTALQTPIEELVQMGKAGAEFVAQNHTVAVEAGKLVTLFRQAASDCDNSTWRNPVSR